MLDINIPVPCVQGSFGRRLYTYTTQIKPSQIKQVLGHDPRPKFWKNLPESTRLIYEKIQRKTSKDRRNAVSDYLLQRLGPRKVVAAFPAISIGISHPTEFKPLPNTIGQEDLGTLLIHDRCDRIVLDGLGRIHGCLDLLEESQDGKEIVDSIALPVTFYLPALGTEPLTTEELGQLFADFNFRVHPVPAQVNIALDQSDIYISFANQLAKEQFISKNGGMETRSASLGKKSTALVVQTVLVRTVRGACEGRDFQENNLAQTKDANLNDATFTNELDSVATFFTEIQQRMGTRWNARESLHLSSPGWQALGVLHHDMHHRGLDLAPREKAGIYDLIANIDWSRTNREWVDDARLGVWDKPKGSTVEQVVILGAGRNNAQAIIDFLRKRTHLQEKLDALKSENSILTPQPDEALAMV